MTPTAPACHTGETSCFFNLLEGLPEDYEVSESGPGVLSELFAVIQDRQSEMPEGSYTTKLLQGGVGRIAQKVIEEAGETAHRRGPGMTRKGYRVKWRTCCTTPWC